MTTERSGFLTPRLVFGGFLMALGVLFTLGNLGLVEARPYLKYWPVMLIAVGLTHLAGGSRRSIFGGAVWILIGGWLLADNLDLVSVSFWRLWPGIVILLIGGSLVAGGLRPRPRPRESPSDDAVKMFALMGGHVRGNSSKRFRGGEMTAVMGGCGLDLRQAELEGGAAAIEVFALMGGIELKVPEGWTVVSNVVPVMGGVEDKTRADREGGPRLVLNGVVVMGGVEVRH
ncbi:MAG: DUF5668 domain-containing protein [Vicinamibacteria bacterium]